MLPSRPPFYAIKSQQGGEAAHGCWGHVAMYAQKDAHCAISLRGSRRETFPLNSVFQKTSLTL